MTTGILIPERLLPPASAPSKTIGAWGMILFCVTEGVLFALLFSSYFYLGSINPSWPPLGTELPKLVLPLIMTAMLLASSVVLMLGTRARARDDKRTYLAATTATVCLGVAFLLLQAVEYSEKLRKMPPQVHSYASLFYTITGLHGVHVLMGLLMLGWVAIADGAGRLPMGLGEPVSVFATSLYWHFVDGVWLVIVAIVYLSPWVMR